MDNIIKVSNVTYHYDEEQHPALLDVNLNIHRGEWLSIIGQNGSGKSTLIKVLDGLIQPDQGYVNVDGIDLNEDNLGQIHDLIGMVFQNPDNQFVGSNVEDDIAFGLENHRIEHDQMQLIIEQSLLKVGMKGYNLRTPSELSGGQKQRIALAGIIALQPKIIVLDEATSMLDPRGRQQILNLINELHLKEKITVIAVTHDAGELIYSDRILIMDHGKLISEQTQAQTFEHLDQIHEMGLSIPFSESLRLKLLHQGVPVPDHYVDSKELSNWIMQLPLRK